MDFFQWREGKGLEGKRGDKPSQLAPPFHPLVNILIDPIRLVVVAVVLTVGEKASFILGILEALVIVILVVVLFLLVRGSVGGWWSCAKLLCSFRERFLDLFRGGSFARWD